MLRLVIFIILLVASVWLGIELMRHPGYLLIVYKPWLLQMPIWFAALSLFVIFVLFYLLIDSVDRLQFLWFRMKNWFKFRREHQSYSKTQHGLATLIEGRWKRAEQLLISGAEQTVEPLMNYLGAAEAAHAQHAFERRDLYIEKAYKIAPDAHLAIGIKQAELEIDQHQLEQAKATLNHLLAHSPHHPRVLQLLEEIDVKLGDWPHLLTLLPGLRKAKVLTSEQLSLFEKNLYIELLRPAYITDQTVLVETWGEAPRHVRKNPEVITAYLKQLLRFVPDSKEAENLIRKTLKQGWQPELVKLYSDIETDNVNKQLVVMGAWLKTYGPQPEILLGLGKVCVRAQLWGKAKDYFEKCLSIKSNPEASLEYGKLLEKLNEPNEAILKYREGLAGINPVVGLQKENKSYLQLNEVK